MLCPLRSAPRFLGAFCSQALRAQERPWWPRHWQAPRSWTSFRMFQDRWKFRKLCILAVWRKLCINSMSQEFSLVKSKCDIEVPGLRLPCQCGHTFCCLFWDDHSLSIEWRWCCKTYIRLGLAPGTWIPNSGNYCKQARDSISMFITSIIRIIIRNISIIISSIVLDPCASASMDPFSCQWNAKRHK